MSQADVHKAMKEFITSHSQESKPQQPIVTEESTDALALISTAKRVLSTAKDLTEVLEIHDKAAALLAYSNAKGADEVAAIAQEIKLRSERKAGQFLKEMPDAKTGPKELGVSMTPNSIPTLKELNIDKNESKRWQAIASIPEDKFEEYVGRAKTRTQAAMIQCAVELENEIKGDELRANPIPLPEGQFDVILADPPWKYEFGFQGGVQYHYPTMTVEEISALRIPASPDAVLVLWATAPKLREALEVMKAWGFEYKTNAVWIKEGGIGIGYYFRGQHELLLVGTKGTPSLPEESVRVASVIIAKREGHSEKPEVIYEIIEKMYPNGRYLELFARGESRTKWTTWGAGGQ
jgi:N6-adenosine-specific RNA methylase IME4